MGFRSAWALLLIAAAWTAASGGCSAYPEREYGKGSGGAATAGASGAGGGAGSNADASAGGTSTGGGGGAMLGDASSKDALSPPGDATVDRQICNKPGMHPPPLDCHCADGSVEDRFGPTLFGCGDAPDPNSTTWAQRALLCGPGCRVATAIQWVAMPGHGNARPTHNYWLDDDLTRTAGMGSGMCAVNTRPMGEMMCLGQPMRICVSGPAGGPVRDPVGSTCDLHDCGFETVMPNNFFGGCAANRTAGALCFCP